MGKDFPQCSGAWTFVQRRKAPNFGWSGPEFRRWSEARKSAEVCRRQLGLDGDFRVRSWPLWSVPGWFGRWQTGSGLAGFGRADSYLCIPLYI